MKRLLFATVGLLYICAGAAQEETRTLHEIVDSFGKANIRFVDRLGGKDHAWALLRGLHSAKMTRLQRCSYHYALAICGIEISRHVREMTENAMLNWGTRVGEELEALPEALGSVYRHTANFRALQVLMDLRLDGGPAETQMGAVGGLFLKSPRDVAGFILKRRGSLSRLRALLEGSGQQGYLLSGLKRELAGNIRLDPLKAQLKRLPGNNALAAVEIIDFVQRRDTASVQLRCRGEAPGYAFARGDGDLDVPRQ
jgi:hypothetical protein